MKLIHPEGPWKAPWITAVEGRNGKAMICTGVKGLWFSLIRKTIILCGAGHGLLDLSLSWSNSSKILWEICSKAVVIILTKPNRVTRRSGWKPGDVLYTLPLLNSTRLFYFPNIWAFCRCCLLPYLLWKNKVEKNPKPQCCIVFISHQKKSWTLSLWCLLTVVSVHITFCWKNHENVILWFERESSFRSFPFHLLPKHHYVTHENWRNISYKKWNNETILPA